MGETERAREVREIVEAWRTEQLGPTPNSCVSCGCVTLLALLVIGVLAYNLLTCPPPLWCADLFR